MTTTPTASPGPLDLARLEALARAADEGEGQHIYTNPRDSDGWQAKEAWHHAASPAAVLALIALARRAQPYATGGMVPGGLHLAGEGLRPLCGQPESEATQAAPLSEVQIDRIARAYFSEQWAVQHAKDVIHDAFEDARKSATLSPLCGAQHAESGKEVEQELRSQMAFIAAYDANELDGGDSQEGMRAADRLACIIRRARKTLDVCDALAAQQAAAPGALTRDALAQMLAGKHVNDYGYRMLLNGEEIGFNLDNLLDIVKTAATSAPGTPEAPKTAAARDVLAERQRQVEQEGWTLERDDQYVDGQLASAAVAYVQVYTPYLVPHSWPWSTHWFKPADDRRNLVKAGALLLAEIERLDRAAQLDGGQEGSDRG